MSAAKQQIEPKRIQRKRVKGWTLAGATTNPNGAMSVTRPGPWGNCYTVEEYGEAAIQLFEFDLEQILKDEPDYLEPLRGKDLACFCPLEDKDGNPVPCHADILLKWANRKEPTQAPQ
jgi:hypothetical protein